MAACCIMCCAIWRARRNPAPTERYGKTPAIVPGFFVAKTGRESAAAQRPTAGGRSHRFWLTVYGAEHTAAPQSQRKHVSGTRRRAAPDSGGAVGRCAAARKRALIPRGGIWFWRQ